MTRLRLAVPLVAMSACVALAAQQQIPTYRAGVRTVSVYTTVVDAEQHLVTDLSRKDFTVYDNGVPQDITVFANDVQPITAVMMLDRSASVEPDYRLVETAAEQFVSELLPADKARIGSFSTTVRIDPADFTSDHGVLVDVLRHDLQGAGPTPLWNAAAAAMESLSHESGRRVALLFTDGRDNPDGPGESFADVRDQAETNEVMLYGIGLVTPCDGLPVRSDPVRRPEGRRLLPAREVLAQLQRGGRLPPPGQGLPFPRPPFPTPNPGGVVPPPVGPPGPLGLPGGTDMPHRRTLEGAPCTGVKPDPDLRTIVAENGGGYVELKNTQDLGAAFARVADELHHQYLLAFNPAVLDGQVHHLQVRVNRSDVTVRARQSYVASPDKGGT